MDREEKKILKEPKAAPVYPFAAIRDDEDLNAGGSAETKNYVNHDIDSESAQSGQAAGKAAADAGNAEKAGNAGNAGSVGEDNYVNQDVTRGLDTPDDIDGADSIDPDVVDPETDEDEYDYSDLEEETGDKDLADMTDEEVKAELKEQLDEDINHDDDDDDDEAPAEKPDYTLEIAGIIKSNASPRALRERLSDYHDNDIAETLLTLTPAYRKKVYRVLDVSTLSGILEYADDDEIAQYLDEMDVKKAAVVLSHMEPDVAIAVLREMEKSKRLLMVDLVDDDFRRDIALLASFDEDEIGSKMTTNYIVIHDNLTVKEAMTELVRQAPENDNISTIFVLDGSNVFCGAIDLKDLIIARQGTPLDDLIMTSYPYVYGTETIDDCIEKLKDYSEDLIPVLDNSNQMLGVITSQSIIQVVDDELGEDYARLAGLTAEEELAEPLKDSMRKRLPWLIALLILGMVVSTVVGVFEGVISQLTLIMFFQSMILDMSGNAGTQSLAVTIRVLMDENLTAKQKAGHVFKEVRVGFCNGILLSSVAVILVGLYIMILKDRPPHMAFAISGCVGVALLTAMTLASLLGTTIPMILTKLKVDPAVASGPLITTLNDLIAVITYYSMSYVLLIKMLGLSG